MTLEMVASASQFGGDVHLWKCDPESWQGDDASQIEPSLKRQRTGIKTVSPIGAIKNIQGVTAMQWITNDSIVCGGTDHQLKVMDVHK